MSASLKILLFSDSNLQDMSEMADLAALEQHKENVQPLPSGHSISALQRRFTDKSQESDLLEQQRAKMEALLAIDNSADDDPLDAYYQYIKFVEQHFSQSHPSYMKTLQDTVRRFKTDRRYSNDVRYLQVWMRVAKLGREPLAVFKYLSERDIGQQLALFYEEYSHMLETHSRWKDAEDILCLGLSRNAQPVSRLSRSLDAFRQRKAHNDTQDPDDLDDAQSVNPAKSALRAVASGRSQQMAGIARLPMAQKKDKVSSSSASGKFQVFSDAEDKPLTAQERLLPIGSASSSSRFVDEATRHKENIVQSTAWVGETLSQRKHLSEGGDRISVFQDNSDSLPPRRQDMPECHVLKPRIESTASTSTFLDKLDQQVENTQQATNDSNKKSTFSFSTKYELFIQNGTEISFEEYRASLPKYRFQPTPTSLGSPAFKNQQESRKAIPVASPTINTKAAMADVFEMFQVPLGVEQESPFIHGGQSNRYDFDDEDETISSKVYRAPVSDAPKMTVFRDNDDDSNAKPPVNHSSDGRRFIEPKVARTPLPRGIVGDEVAMRHFEMNESRPNANILGSQIALMTPIAEASVEFSDASRIHPDGSVSSSSGINGSNGFCSTIRSRSTTIAGMSTILEEHPDDTMAYLRRNSAGMTDSQHECSYGDDALESSRLILDGLNESDGFNHGPKARNAISKRDEVHLDEAMADLRLTSKQPGQELNKDTFLDFESPCDPRDDCIRETVMDRSNAQQRIPIYVDMEADLSAMGLFLEKPKFKPNSIKIGLNPFGEASLVRPLGCSTLCPSGSVVRESNAYLCKLESQRAFISRQDVKEDQDDEFDEEALLRELLEDDDDDDIASFSSSKNVKGSKKARESEDSNLVLKLQTPASMWERYIMNELSSRLEKSTSVTRLNSVQKKKLEYAVVQAKSLHMMRNASCLVLPYIKYGSLVDCANLSLHSSFGMEDGGVNEALAAFWTIEMIDIVCALHEIGIVHGDIRAQHFLVRFDKEDVTHSRHGWSGGNADGLATDDEQPDCVQARYRSDGGGGWMEKGLMLVDWTKAIDLKVFKGDQQFIYDSQGFQCDMDGSKEGDEQRQSGEFGRNVYHQQSVRCDPSLDCVEIRLNQPWRFQPDWYGLASVCHLLLFRSDMEVIKKPTLVKQAYGGEQEVASSSTVNSMSNKNSSNSSTTRLEFARPMKRHWQIDTWRSLIDVLLNSGQCGASTPGDCIAEVRKHQRRLQEWLEPASIKGSTMLRGLLSSCQAALLESKLRK